MGAAAAAAVPGTAGATEVQPAAAAEPIAAPAAPVAPGGGNTMAATVDLGPPDASGYRTLVQQPGKPHVLRGISIGTRPMRIQPLVAFGHLSDLHVVDDQSPLRLEFLDRLNDDPFTNYDFSSAYRPNEWLSLHLVDAMCRSLKGLRGGPRTGQKLDFTIVTGDAVDNAQTNETRWYIDLLDGGRTVNPNSGGPVDESVSGGRGLHPDFRRKYYQPELEVVDKYKLAGFRRIPGALANARRPFTSSGLGMPWYTAYGNHDAQVQGNLSTGTNLPRMRSLREVAVGSDKWQTLDFSFPRDGNDLGVASLFLDWPVSQSVTVTADPRRRLLSPAEFVDQHFTTAPDQPPGHGFVRGEKLYYAKPFRERDRVRFIALDTVSGRGVQEVKENADGGIDREQFDWLEEQLRANSRRYFDASGQLVTQRHVTDMLYVLYGHHPIRTITNQEKILGPGHTEVATCRTGQELKQLLLRFPNVVLYANGHTHRNEITPHSRVSGGGFWEVSAAAHLDWPVQSRVIEIASGEHADGAESVTIYTTVFDIDAPVRPGDSPSTLQDLAALGRELAANDPQGDLTRRGSTLNFNAELVVPAPFPLFRKLPLVGTAVFHGVTGLNTFQANKLISTPSRLAPSTSPATAVVATGGYRKAFQAVDRTLWVEEPDNNGRRLSVPVVDPGTSPSIACVGFHWMIAYSVENRLWTVDRNGAIRDTTLPMRPGSSPSIVAMDGHADVFKVAYVGPDNLVRIYDTRGGRAPHAGNGLGAAPGTNPSMASKGIDSWQVAIHGGDDRLWIVNSHSGQWQGAAPLKAGAGPSVAAVRSGSYRTAWVGAAGDLWVQDPDRVDVPVAGGLLVGSNSSPSIATVPDGWKIAFKESVHNVLWTVDHNGTLADSRMPMAPGTSPSIVGND
jgi:metallophosphoesterase (TIGR03767 family)